MSNAEQWQPIETAPKEPMDEHAYGPTVLLWVDGNIGVGFWDYDFRKFYVEYPEGGAQPTHWMPLPAEPQCEHGNVHSACTACSPPKIARPLVTESAK